MKKAVVDFESWFSTKEGVSVKLQGVPRYTEATYAYLVSIVTEDVEFCGTLEEARQHFPESFWSDPELEVYASNSNFDKALADKYGFKTVHPWKCVLDIGAGNQLPRNLAQLCKVALGITMSKEVRDAMDGVHYADLSDERKQEMIAYCLDDSIRAKEVIEKIPALSDVEDQVAELTRLRNRRGIHIDTERVDRDLTKLHKLKHEAFLTLPWRSEAKPLSPQALAAWCSSKGIPVPRSRAKTDAACAEIIKQHPEFAKVLGAMRAFTSTNKLIKKGETLKMRLTDDNRLPLDLLYCGAPHTRRCSAQGWNILNLEKNAMSVSDESDDVPEDNAEEEESIWIREWLIPAPGKVFLIFDFSQIEPRCLNWLVGNDELLAMIRAGYGIYEAHAMRVKGWRGNAGTLKKENDRLYAVCKEEILGLGFGVGAKKFISSAAKVGINLTLDESKKIVNHFRTNNPGITKMWSQMDNLLKNAILSKEKHLEITMPTGDKLRHFHVQSTLKEMTLEDGTKIKKPSLCTHKIQGDFRPKISKIFNVWGGVLCENVTQRTARDVMVEAMLRCEKAGFETKFDVYDELVFEIDDGSEAYLKDATKQCEELLTIVPEWAEGLPLAVEGQIARCYTK